MSSELFSLFSDQGYVAQVKLCARCRLSLFINSTQNDACSVSQIGSKSSILNSFGKIRHKEWRLLQAVLGLLLKINSAVESKTKVEMLVRALLICMKEIICIFFQEMILS